VARSERFQDPGCYHVFSRATGGIAFFRDNDDRAHFKAILERVAQRHEWGIDAYCLMTTHYHAVLTTHAANLSVGMQHLNATYVRAFNDRWGRFGTLVSSRFGSRWIEAEERWLVAVEYVFYNPVKAGLCDRPGEWPWSGGTLFEAVSEL
jgi:REP-associated tyrosine transposase